MDPPYGVRVRQSQDTTDAVGFARAALFVS